MQKLTTEIKIGLFVILAVFLLGYMTLRVGEFTIGRVKGYVIHGVFDSVAGLDMKAPVKMAGVGIGTVEAISLEDGRAKVSMRINPDVSVRKGVTAAIKSESLLGEKYVELLQGVEEGFLKDGDIIYKSVSAADLDSLITRLDTVAEDLKSVTLFFKETIGAPETRKAVNDIIRNLRNLTQSLYSMTERNRDALDRIVKNLDDLTGQIKGIAEENRGPLKNSLANLEEISEELKVIAQENRGPLKDTMGNLQELSADLKESAPRVLGKIDRIVERLERGEGTVGKLMKEESFYEKLDSTLTGLNKYVTATERFRLILGFRPEYLIDEDDTKGYFSLKLQPREDKYYLFEIIDDPRGRVKVTDREVATDSGTTVTTHEVKREEELKFSALFARKFGKVALRGGLMEDSFGVGADYYLKDDQISASIDAWDFDGDGDVSNPHLKFTANYMVFRSLFINAGFDDFINSKTSSAFAGVGLSLDDEDLKYLLTRLPISLP